MKWLMTFVNQYGVVFHTHSDELAVIKAPTTEAACMEYIKDCLEVKSILVKVELVED